MITKVKWLGDGKSEETCFELDIPIGQKFISFIGSDKPVMGGIVEVELYAYDVVPLP